MNELECQLIITYNEVTNKPNMLSFIDPTDTDTELLNFYITVNPPPMLILDCYTSDTFLYLYEYAINYIIDNKIAKYNYLNIIKYNNKYYHVSLFFDIIDTNILLQLL